MVYMMMMMWMIILYVLLFVSINDNKFDNNNYTGYMIVNETKKKKYIRKIFTEYIKFPVI